MGSEPPHFLAILQGQLVVFQVGPTLEAAPAASPAPPCAHSP